MIRLLLISNSTVHGRGYLDHCERALRETLAGVSELLFIPYALKDHDGYAAVARRRFEALGIGLRSLHEAAEHGDSERDWVAGAEAIFTGGGNTFRLLKTLYDLDLLGPVRERVEGGAPYVGSSAGSNVACVSIRTTNDMPIVRPPSFRALGFVPFNLNPHYLDPDPDSTHMGETREQRILQFHEENDPPVVGLREGGWLRRTGDELLLEGASVRLFQKGYEPQEIEPPAKLDFLLRRAGRPPRSTG